MTSTVLYSDPLRGSWPGTLTSGAVGVSATIPANTAANTAAAAAASLGDFDNLQSDQLDLGAAILQHLLSCGQHLILDNDITSRDNKRHFITTAATTLFSPLTDQLSTAMIYQNKWHNMRESPETAHTHKSFPYWTKTSGKEETG